MNETWLVVVRAFARNCAEGIIPSASSECQKSTYIYIALQKTVLYCSMNGYFEQDAASNIQYGDILLAAKPT